MGNFTYALQNGNLVPSATVTANSEDALYPLANLTDPNIGLPYRTDALVTGLDILVDLNTTGSTWNLIALINHNFTATTVVTIKSGTTTSVLDHTDVVDWRAGDIFLLLSPSRTNRYMRILVTDSGSNPDGYLSIGYLYMGAAITFSFNFMYGWRTKYVKSVRAIYSDLDTLAGTNFISAYKVFTLSFQALSQADAATLAAMLENLYGISFWFFLIPESGIYDGYAVRLTSDAEFSREFYTAINVQSLTFREEGRGIRLGV